MSRPTFLGGGGGPTRRRNSTGLAELLGGWPIEQDILWVGVITGKQ